MNGKNDAEVLPKLLDIRAIAGRYQVKVVTVRKWRRDGRFPEADVRVGLRAFWTDASVAEWERRETWRKEEMLKPIREEGRRRATEYWAEGGHKR